MSPAIRVENLSKTYQVFQKPPGFAGSIRSIFRRKYETVHAVANISFDIQAGELIGFIGPNGAGKTTTLKCLSGLLFPTQGTITVLGYTPFERKHPYLKKIALVMGQKNQLWWDLPAMETFLLNKEIYQIPDTQFRRSLSDLVDLLGVSDKLKIQVRQLSLGERMKMELIAALVHRPQVLFLDEPTIGLDVVMQKNLRDFISSYNRKYHATILLTSHDMEDVRQLSKRIIIIDHGTIIYDGFLEQLVRRYATYKVLTVLFEKEIDQEKLQRIGEVVEFRFPKAVIKVPRGDSNTTASQLLKSFPIDDLNVTEPDIEDVIRGVFAKGKISHSPV